MVLSSCSSSGTSSATQSASPKSACSLLTAQEASKALGGTVQSPTQCRTSPGSQSGGLYHRSAGQGTLLVHVSWDKRAVKTFAVAHSGHATYPDGAVPPQYAKVTVAGTPAYWQLSPAAGPVGARAVSSLKGGYVVTINSMGLDQSQVEQALADILSHL